MSRRVGLLFILTFSLLNPRVGFAQQEEVRTDSGAIANKKLKRLILISSAGYGVTMLGLSQLWYKDFDKQPFSFFDDSQEWFQVDKLGHTYTTYHLGAFARNALARCHVPKNKAATIGAVSSFVMVSSIEIFDGYSSGYGASASDLVANTLGSALFWGQHRLWDEQRILPKFSFHQTDFPPLRPALLGTNLMEQIIKDYNGQTYWLSFDMDRFCRFPWWLNVAIGYGAEGFVYADKNTNILNRFSPQRQFYFGVDFDLSGIPTRSKFLKSVLSAANLIRLPAPTLELTEGKVRVLPFYF
jgi:hypothetical protein